MKVLWKYCERNNSLILNKLQIIPLKFGGDWILHPKISKFRFYTLTFGGVWILHPDISKFWF